MNRWPQTNTAESRADDGTQPEGGAGVLAGTGAVAAILAQRSMLPDAGAAIALALAGPAMAVTAVLGIGLGKGMESAAKELGKQWRLRKVFEGVANGAGIPEDIVVGKPLRFKSRNAGFTMILSPQMQGAW